MKLFVRLTWNSASIDSDSGQPHIYNHGVTEEVNEVLAQPDEDRPSAENSRMAVGRTRNGRYLRVVYVPDPGGESAFVVTAFDLGDNEKKAYRRRWPRRGK